MARPSSASAPQGATGKRRHPRRRARGGRGDWVRPFQGVHRSINASLRLIYSTLRTVARAERCAHRRPIRTSQNLDDASGRLVEASQRLVHAAAGLQRMNECMARAPENAADGPACLAQATHHFLYVAQWITEVADEVFSLHEDVLARLESGELVPERSALPRRRIVLAPRPVPVRAFLRARLPRVVERISPLLQRRRRTRLPAAVRVPRRTWQGRAPPLFSVCSL